MSDDNKFKEQFNMSFEVLIDMFLKRKYITEEELKEMREDFKKFGDSSEKEFILLEEKCLIMKGQVSSKSSNKNKKNIKTPLPTGKYDNMIILTPDKPDKSQSKKENEINSQKTGTNGPKVNIVEIFMGEWLYNPLDNILQTEFIKLTEEEKTILLSHYDIKDSNLPKMDINDKISKFYDCKEKDILKITRYNTNGIQYYYRIVRSIV